MKKKMVSMLILSMSVLLASCGQTDGAQGVDLAAEAEGDDYQSSAAPESSAAEPDGSQPEELPVTDPKEEELLKKQGEGESENWVEEEVFLSDQILGVGDTMQVMYPEDENNLYHRLDVTLCGMKLADSPEDAGLDRSQMVSEAENYDTTGNPEWCGLDEGKVLVCDLTVRNVEGASDGELHIGELMVAYADPDTGKVTMISCAPVFFSASSSEAGKSDYYHYRVPQGESCDMAVVWMIQDSYETDNLYLGVTYDARKPEERQYFHVGGQE